MGKKFLDRQHDKLQMAFEVGERIGFQRACDFVAIALNSPEVMGKSVMSGEKIDKIFKHAIEIDGQFCAAFEAKNPECDYYRAKVDERQKMIFKDKFEPFEKRYRYLKDVKY